MYDAIQHGATSAKRAASCRLLSSLSPTHPLLAVAILLAIWNMDANPLVVIDGSSCHLLGVQKGAVRPRTEKP